MKLARCKVPVDAVGARVDSLGSLGAWWAQLGDEVLLYSADAKWDEVEAAAARGAVAIEPLEGSVAKRDLHLVAQKGRLFQQAHPEVRILVDKGRYLIVAIDRERARRLADPDGVCYAIRPLTPNLVVFDQRTAAAPAERRAPLPWVQALVNRISRPAFEASLRRLASFHTRLSTSDEFALAAAWARSELMGMGYGTTLELVPVSSGASRNVIADKPGSGSDNRGLVLIVAHLDSINIPGGEAAAAPGADDNGSGSAGVLEVARVLKDHDGVHDLRFVLFGGEEQGLFGSRQYVAGLAEAERDRIVAVVNMDMIGSRNTPEPGVLIEGAALSQPVISSLASAARDYTGLAVQTSLNPFASDHVPFIDAGVAAVLTIEGADGANQNIHTADDVLADIDHELALEILRMNVGFAAITLDRTGGSTMPDRTDDAPVRMQLSGRYKHNGGVAEQAGRGGVRIASEPSTVHNLDAPIFVDDPAIDPASSDSIIELRFNLHIDIDGTDPLDVVSGIVAQGLGEPAHFIGRVTSNSAAISGRDLVVEDFSFVWPGTGETVNRLEVGVSGGGGMTPTAEVTFVTSSSRRHGPFVVRQESTFFRDVEIEVDREDGATEAEPFDTHTHPDRPADLPRESLTLESAFARSGIRVTRSAGANVIDTSEAGANSRWNEVELHDAMESHWSAFANRPQWKMWIFAAELADEDTLGGIMFDGDIDEPGGVDRQGTALFTKSPFFHSAAGGYPQANAPAAEAATRELFFNLLHETGHAFNLAHSFQKTLGTPWPAPAWMPVISDSRALSWMNYPDQASPGLNATWFYDRFRFRFDDNENLFLRHAPARLVQMGNESWFTNHGRVASSSLDRRLELKVRSLKPIMELGEPVSIELRLKNVSNQPVMVQHNLAPGDGFVQLAITNPRGERRPFLPIMQMRHLVESDVLQPGAALYEPVRLTIGSLGSPFKEPGAYRIEASYSNLDGSTAAAVSQIYVRPPASYEDLTVVNEVFNARVGRVLYMRGTRIMEDVIDKLQWVSKRLGAKHPAQHHLRVARSGGFTAAFKSVDPNTKKVKVMEADPTLVERNLKPVVADVANAADSIGHIGFEQLVDVYTRAAVKAKKKAAARDAQSKMVSLFKKRKVVKEVVSKAEQRLKQLS